MTKGTSYEFDELISGQPAEFHVNRVDHGEVSVHLHHHDPNDEWGLSAFDGNMDITVAVRLRNALTEVIGDEPKVGPKKSSPRGDQQYLGNGKHTWEFVADDGTSLTERLRVPSGWLYAITTNDGVVSQSFVPLPAVVGYAI